MSKETTEQALARRKRTEIGLQAAGDSVLIASGVAAASVPVGGWIVGAAGATVGLGLKVAGWVMDGRDDKLAGDPGVMAKYIRKASGWSEAKRQKEIAQLTKAYEKHIADGDKKIAGKYNRDRDTWKIKKKTLEMKLAALGVTQYNAKKNPDKELVKGDPRTKPRNANRMPQDSSTLPDLPTSADPLPTATTDVPWTPILLAGGAAAVALIFLTRPQAATSKAPAKQASGGGYDALDFDYDGGA